MKLALLFDHFGPYHQARLRAAAKQMDVTGVECYSRSRDYAWEPVESGGLPLVTLPESGTEAPKKRRADFSSRLKDTLTRLNPTVVAVPGWSDAGAFTAVQWCQCQRIPVIVMSESSAHDEMRVSWREWIKWRYVGICSAAFVGGTLHADYLAQLGMPRDHIFLGYDAVDNEYFERESEKVRKHESVRAASLPSNLSPVAAAPHFLASARFIEKKNLPFLLRAYARYRELAAHSPINNPRTAIWNLVLLGDGPLRADLCDLVSVLGLDHCVTMPGFLQYPDLPTCYARAGAFVHASTTEQWGLVVNEAMASGLPVLVSNRCGCAPDLVQEAVNGWTFDPANVEQLAQLFLRIAESKEFSLSALGSASRRIVADWGPERFAEGLLRAGQCAMNTEKRSGSLIDRAMIAVLRAKAA